MTLPAAEAAARAVTHGATTDERHASYYAALATALIAQRPLPLVLPNGLPAPEPEVEQ